MLRLCESQVDGGSLRTRLGGGIVEKSGGFLSSASRSAWFCEVYMRFV
jgi:hypothetical protein